MNMIGKNIELISNIEILVKYLPLDIQQPILQKLNIFFCFIQISDNCLIPNIQFDLRCNAYIVQQQNLLKQNLLSAKSRIQQQKFNDAIEYILKILYSVYDCMNYLQNEKNIQNNCKQQKNLQSYMEEVSDQYMKTCNQLKNEFRLENQKMNFHSQKIENFVSKIKQLEQHKEEKMREINVISQKQPHNQSFSHLNYSLQKQMPNASYTSSKQNNDRVVQQPVTVQLITPQQIQKQPNQLQNQQHQQLKSQEYYSIQQNGQQEIIHIIFYDINEISRLIKFYPSRVNQIKLKISQKGFIGFRKPDPVDMIQKITENLRSQNLSDSAYLYNIILNISELNKPSDYDYVTPKLYRLIKILKEKKISFTIIENKNIDFYKYFSAEIQKQIPGISVNIFQNLNENVFQPCLNKLQISGYNQQNKKELEEVLKLEQKLVQDSHKFHEQMVDQKQHVENQQLQQQLISAEQEQIYQRINSLALDIKQINEEITKQKTLQQVEEELQQKESQSLESQCEKHIQHYDINQIKKSFENIQDLINQINFEADISQYLACLEQKIIELEKLEKSLQRILLSISSSCRGLLLKLNKSMNNKFDLEFDVLLRQLMKQLVGSQVSHESLQTLKTLSIQSFLGQQFLQANLYSQEVQDIYKVIRKGFCQQGLEKYFNAIQDSIETFNDSDYSCNLIQHLISLY